jgi:tetratricopeptide (TPR) repeat protein
MGLGGEATEDKLIATLKFVEQSLPEGLQELLMPLSFYERFVVRSQLQEIAKHVNDSWTDARIDDFFRILAGAGLLRDRGKGIYEIHPGLHGYLQMSFRRFSHADEHSAWARAFVVVLHVVACDALQLKLIKSPRDAPYLFHTYDATFRKASVEARRLGMENYFADIVQTIAHLALDMRHFQNATEFYQQYLEFCERNADARGQAAAYHQLGMVARAKGDYPAAEGWSRKSLQIKHELGDARGAVITQYQLGQIAIDNRNLTAAEELFRIAATEFKRLGDQEQEASANHYRGIVAMKLGRLAEAEAFLYQALDVKRILGDTHGISNELHYLGEIAVERDELTTARQRFQDSLAISIACKDEEGTARTWSALAGIAEPSEAKQFYLKALAIEEKLGSETEMANLYHQLGNITEKEDDILNAKQWFEKALAIDVRRGNEYGFWKTQGQLAKLAFLIGDHINAAELLITGIQGFEKAGDLEDRERNRRNLMSIYSSATEREREIIMEKWEKAGLGPFTRKGVTPAS